MSRKGHSGASRALIESRRSHDGLVAVILEIGACRNAATFDSLGRAKWSPRWGFPKRLVSPEWAKCWVTNAGGAPMRLCAGRFAPLGLGRILVLPITQASARRDHALRGARLRGGAPRSSWAVAGRPVGPRIRGDYVLGQLKTIDEMIHPATPASIVSHANASMTA